MTNSAETPWVTVPKLTHSVFPSFDTRSLTVLCLLWVILALLLTWAPLRKIPGPFLSRLTNIPRTIWVAKRRAHNVHLALHQKYGKVVRMGPNMVSFSDPAAIPIIYGFDGRFQKSDMYSVFRPYARTKVITGMIAQQDEEHHKMLRRPFATIYSARSLEPMEHLVTEVVEVFLKVLRRHVGTGKDLDIGLLLQLCVWDALCNVTFSSMFGFLEKGEDVDGMLQRIWKEFYEGAPISQLPWYDWVWRKNPVLMKLMPGFRMTPIVPFAIDRINERRTSRQMAGSEKDSKLNDILDHFLAAKERDPSAPDWALLTWTLGGLGAGGDTSVNVLRALLFNLLAHPKSLAKLRSDVAEAGLFEEGLTWKKARSLPYLDACIKEAARIHPSIGLPLERVVPEGGATISGSFMPAGTVVGVNAWVVNRDPTVFGDDSQDWRPERWLCEKTSRMKMEQALFSLGGGHRICPGQALFDLIATKVLIGVIKDFDLELKVPPEGLQIENSFLVRQTGFFVRPSLRNQNA